MGIAGTNCLGGPATTQVHGCQITAHFTRPVTTIIVATLPELATTVCTPTLDAAVIQQGTAKSKSCRDLDGGATA